MFLLMLAAYVQLVKMSFQGGLLYVLPSLERVLAVVGAAHFKEAARV